MSVLARFGGRERQRALLAGWGAAFLLLCGMLVWGHYFTLAVPGALIAMRPRPHRPDGGRPMIVVGLFVYALLAFHKQFREMGWTDWGNYSPFTLLGAALSLGIALWDIADVARPRLAVADADR